MSARRGVFDGELTVVRAVDEIEALRPLWERLHGDALPSDIDYFLTVARHHPAVIRPHVVVVRPRTGEPSLLVGHLYRMPLGHRFARWSPYRPTVHALNFYHCVVGRPTEDALAAVLRSLAAELGSGVDAILLRNLEPGSALHEAALRVFPARLRQRWVPVKVRWASDIGSSAEETLGSRSAKTRANVRRVRRKLSAEFGERAVVRVFQQPSEADELFRDLDALAVKTYQTQFQPVFRDNEFEQRLAEVALAKGWYRAFLLYIDGRPVAYWTGFRYGGAFGWRGVTGYDPAFRPYSVGTYLLTHVLDELSHDPGVGQFSLGPGHFPYKRVFGDRRWEEVDVRVLAATPRGLLVNAVGSALQGLQAAWERAQRIRRVGERAEELRERSRRKQQGLSPRR